MVTIDLDSLAGFQIVQLRVDSEPRHHDHFGSAVRVFLDMAWHEDPELTASAEALVALNPEGARVIWLSGFSSDRRQLSWPEQRYAHLDGGPEEVPAPLQELTTRLLCVLAIRSIPALRRCFVG